LPNEIQGEEKSTLSVKSERRVAIGDEKQGHDRAVIILPIDDEFYTVAPSLLLLWSQELSFSGEIV
jgi:hypothetical protein